MSLELEDLCDEIRRRIEKYGSEIQRTATTGSILIMYVHALAELKNLIAWADAEKANDE